MNVLRGAALRARLLALPPRERDAFVDRMLGFEAPPPDVADLPRGAVPYLPCPVAEILDFVGALHFYPHDELVDLGSGVGRVVLLVHLLTGVRARGIEIQEPLVAIARERCATLGLTEVSFTCANAADTALDGSLFFLYAPFNGALLTAVLARLEQVARRRRIVIATVDSPLPEVSWLTRWEKPTGSSLAFYDSRT